MSRLILLALVMGVTVSDPVRGEPLSVGASVRDADGTPVAGARAELAAMASNFEWARGLLEEGRSVPEPAAAALTDEKGFFRLEAPRLGVWTVRVEAPGFVPMRYFPLPIAGAVELPPVTLLRDEGTRIEIRRGDSPVAGVWIMPLTTQRRFWQRSARVGWRPTARLAASDETGRVRLPRPAGEKLEIHGFANPGRPLYSSAVEGQVALTLDPVSVGRRRLVVRDPKGEPVAGVVVSMGDWAWPAGRTAADGGLDFDDPGSGPMRFHLFSADGRRFTTQLELGAAGDAEIALRLPRATRLEGRVLDAAQGQPVRGALVWPGSDPGAFTFTDPEGRYELFIADGGRYWVQAESPGFLPAHVTVERTGREVETADDALLRVAASRAGRVVDRAGKPIAGARLEAHLSAPSERPRLFRFAGPDSRATSGADGRFTLGGLIPDAAYELAASGPGLAPAAIRFDARGDGAAPLTVVLEPARSAHGRVLDGSEQPLEGVEVEIAAEAAPGRPDTASVHVRSDAAGEFELAELPGSRIDVAARKSGFTTLEVRGIEIPEGDGPVDLGTLILIPGVSLRGMVADPEGVPIAGASVWFVDDVGQSRLNASLMRDDPAVTTDGDGRFEIADLKPRQKVHLLLHAQTYLSRSILGVELPASEPLRVILERASGVSGRVVDAAGEPIEGARVLARRPDLAPGTLEVRERRRESTGSATSDAAGRFRIAELASGAVVIEARARGFQPSPILEIEIPESGTVDDLELVLERGAAVEGWVSNRRGDPVAGAAVFADRVSGRTGENGVYRLDGVPPGRRSIDVRHPGYESGHREIDVVAGVHTADFVLDGGFAVSGRVLDKHGTPVVGAGVELVGAQMARQREYRASTDADGRFHFAEVVTGPYDVVVEKAGYSTAEIEQAFEVVDRSVDGVEVILQLGTVVAGHILGLDFEELAVVRLRAERGERSPVRQGRSLDGTVDYAGRYEVRDLGPGDWLIQAGLRGGSREAHVRVLIEPGVERLERDLRFDTGVVLTGQALHGGEPLHGARISLAGLEKAVERSVVADHEGRFRMEDLEPGPYRLGLSSPRELVSHYEDLLLAGDQDLVLEVATARVSGRVHTPDGQGVDSAQLSFQRLLGPDATEPGPLLSLSTGADGRFRLARVSGGSYRLTVSREGFTPTEERVDVRAAESLELDLELTPGTGLDLVARLASGTAPAWAAVFVYDETGRAILSENRTPAPDGTVRFDTVPSGTWDVVVLAPDSAATRLRATVPGPAREVVLAPAGGLEVRVPELVESSSVATMRLVDGGGQPFTGVDGDGLLKQEWILIAGAGAVEYVPVGPWRVEVESADGRLWQNTVVIAPGQTVEVSLE